MITVMPPPTTAPKADWQLGHMPKLSYRNAVPSGEALEQRNTTGAATLTKPNRPGLSIREIREALPQQSSPSPTRSLQISSPVQTQKSKKSFLGGLFAKEPSMAALDQVTQSILVQHGSISPATMPYVSSQKMPGHVPKVNSKWDGVPDHIKMREKMKASGRSSLRPVNSRSRSSEIQEDQSFIRRRNSNAASTSESWDSRSTGSRPVFQDDASMRPGSVYSASSGDSVHSSQKLTYGMHQNSSVSTGPKSPDVSLYSLDELPVQYRKSGRSLMTGPSVDTIPDYTESSTTTPPERSPKTPTVLCEDEHSLDSPLVGEPILGGPIADMSSCQQVTPKRIGEVKTGGVSKKNPRTGLGLQTNMIAPWENQSLPSEAPQSPQAKSPTRFRGKGFFSGK